jgi:NitT/TauT family transport system substrate-binding protein
MNRLMAAVLVGAALVLPRGGAHAEAAEIRVAKQYGLGYVQYMMMEDRKLIEKAAKEAGLGDVKTTWATFRSSDVMNDALISGSVDIVSLGIPGLATIWAKTRGNIEVKGLLGLNTQPLFLNTRNPEVKSIRDLTAKDKIALPAIKVSNQAIILQMAAAKEWGIGEYAKLDPLTVSMTHPDGLAALLSGQSEITTHFTSAPFQYRELEKPGIRRILSSYEVTGGAISFNAVATSGRFHKSNPKLTAAVVAAVKEATDLINQDKRGAAELYLRMANDKTPVEDILNLMNDPDIEFTVVPKNFLKIVDFMAEVGSIKVKPASWKDLFFPEAHGLPGS